MDEEDVDYRDLLQHQTPEQRKIQRLEWRWARNLPKWQRATLKVQAWYRGCLDRRKAERARKIRAPVLASRRLYAMAEEAVRGGHISDAMRYLTESIEEQDSRHWPSYSMRGRLRYQEGNVPDALRDLSVCIRETPEDLAALKTRARRTTTAGLCMTSAWSSIGRRLQRRKITCGEPVHTAALRYYSELGKGVG